jgi:hypothetical protein
MAMNAAINYYHIQIICIDKLTLTKPNLTIIIKTRRTVEKERRRAHPMKTAIMTMREQLRNRKLLIRKKLLLRRILR